MVGAESDCRVVFTVLVYIRTTADVGRPSGASMSFDLLDIIMSSHCSGRCLAGCEWPADAVESLFGVETFS